MKTKLILTVLAVIIAAAGFAQGKSEFKVTPAGTDQVKVTFNAFQAIPIELTLTDADGNIMYYNRTDGESTSMKKILDFSEVKNGSFQVSLNYGNCTYNTGLEVTRGAIAIGEEVRTMAPFFKYENDRLMVSCLNPSLKNVYLSVYQNGQYVTSNKLGKELAIHKSFDLSKLEKGNYEIVLSEKNGSHTYVVNK